MFRLDSLEGLVKPYELLVAQISLSSASALWAYAPGDVVSGVPILGLLYVAHSVQQRRTDEKEWIGDEIVDRRTEPVDSDS